MSKFTFICEEDYGVSAKRTVEFESGSLNEVLAEVEMFLRGSGFYFHGTLDIVDEDEVPEKQNFVSFNFDEIPKNNWPFTQTKPESSCISENIKPLTTTDLANLAGFKFEMPGTLGGAKVTFASEK